MDDKKIELGCMPDLPECKDSTDIVQKYQLQPLDSSAITTQHQFHLINAVRSETRLVISIYIIT